jgi:hypothetical protein
LPCFWWARIFLYEIYPTRVWGGAAARASRKPVVRQPPD